MYKVYVIRHSNSEYSYVGKTNDIKQRMRGHLSDSINDPKTFLHNWLSKYPDAEIIPIHEYNTEIEAFTGETFYISLFKSLGVKLMNHTNGGEGTSGYKHTAETKKKISEVHTKKEYSKESRKKMSEAKEENNHFYKTQPRKQDSIYKQAQSMVKNNRAILCFDLKGNYLSKYNNASEIIHTLLKPEGKKCSTGDIFANCNRKQFKCKGYIFQYEDDNQIKDVISRINDKSNPKGIKIPINQLDLEGKLIKLWKSAWDASQFLSPNKIISPDIHSCCQQKQKTCFNYKWEYAKDNWLEDYKLDINKEYGYKDVIIPKEYFLSKTREELSLMVNKLTDFMMEIQPDFPFDKMKIEQKSYKQIIDIIQNYDLGSVINGDTFLNTTSSEGVQFLKSRFLSYWKSSYKNGSSPIKVWNRENIRKIITYRIGDNSTRETFDFTMNQIVKGISAVRGCISFFKPIVAASVYKKFLKNKEQPTVLDPCAGFGGRLLGFKSMYPNGKYVGLEPNKETFDELMNLVSECNFRDVHLYNCKAEDFEKYKDYDFNLTFTSIPYYDKEIYSQNLIGSEYTSIEDWVEKFITNGILKFNNLVINIPQDLEKIIPPSLVKETYYLKNNSASHLNKKDKSKHELILSIINS